MLTGNEKIKYVEDNDICNYIGNALAGLGVKSVSIENFGKGEYKHKALYVRYSQGDKTIIEFNSERKLNATIDEIKRELIYSIQQYRNARK